MTLRDVAQGWRRLGLCTQLVALCVSNYSSVENKEKRTQGSAGPKATIPDARLTGQLWEDLISIMT